MKEVSQYNYALGRLLVYLNLIVNLRVRDVVLRKNKFQEARKERNRLINLKKKRDTDMLVELGVARADNPDFNEEEWTAQFNEAYPKIEVPDPFDRELDLDYDGAEAAEEGEEEQQPDDGGAEEQQDADAASMAALDD